MKKYLILFCALCLFGCVKSTNNIKGQDLSELKLLDKEYKISKIIDKKTQKEYEALSDWSIILDKNRFGMYVGCNRIFGQFMQEKGILKYINPASTKMMCPAMEVENLVTSNLTSQKIIENGLENENIKIIFK